MTFIERISSSSDDHRLPFVAALLIALPWLNPFAPGPTPAVAPLLLSWVCAALLLGLWGLTGPHAEREPYVSAVARAWLAAALLSAGVGLLQYFGWAQHGSPWMNVGTMGEAFANLRQRNQFATLTSIGLVALLWEVAQGAVQARSGRRAGKWLLWGAAALLLAAGNAASGSRTGLFQWWLVAGLALLWWRVLRTRSAAAIPILLAGFGALGLYCLAVVVLPVLLEWATGFQSSGLMGRFKEEVGCQSRRVLWSNVLYLIAQKPWTGWGWNELGYAHFVTLYPGQRFCDILDNAHNLPLHLAVELGVPLAVTVCAALLWLVLRARPWQESDATRQLAWGVLAVIGLHSLLEYPLWYGPFQMAAGLSAVAVDGCPQRHDQTSIPPARARMLLGVA
jgi:O-antigen ligase